MKKSISLLIALLACCALQSCLQYDEPGDELGFDQIQNVQHPDDSGDAQ